MYLNSLWLMILKYTRLTYRCGPLCYKSDSVQVLLEGLLYLRENDYAGTSFESNSNALRAADCSASLLLFPRPSATASPKTIAIAVKLLS
jgi:hypothetical protein